MKPIILKSQSVRKGWGSELVLCNNEEFCGKVLFLDEGAKFSMHFHRDKREVFHVQMGRLALTYIDTTDASKHVLELHCGDTVEIPRLAPHQLYAHENSAVFEFSTHHEDSDSYRVAPGDSQK